MCLSWKIRAAYDCQIFACEEIPPALIVGAAAEAANQVSYGEGHRGSRVRALLDGCAQEVVGLAGTFADGFRGVDRRLLRLSVDILQRTLHLLGLALQLGIYVAGRASESLFHLAAKVLGVAGKAIFIHGRSPSEIRNVNGRGGLSVPAYAQKCEATIWRWRLRGRSLRRSSKLATAVLLLVLDLRSVASKPFHADAGGENADGQQWNELAPAHGTAHLNGAAEDFGVEPGRVSTRRQCELGLFHRAATRPQTANGRDNRRQQEKTRERRRRGQRIVPLGQPDESDHENESGGHDPEYNGKERPDEKAGAETSLSSRP